MDYLYFSLVDYNTLGLGGIYPTGHLRFPAGVEAVNGFLLISCSATFIHRLLTVKELVAQADRTTRRRRQPLTLFRRPCKIRRSARRGQKHDAGHRASRHACGYVSPLAVLVGAHGNARSLSERFNAFSAYKLRSIRAQKSSLMRPQAMARSSHRRLNPAAHSTVCSASPVAPTNQHRFIR